MLHFFRLTFLKADYKTTVYINYNGIIKFISTGTLEYVTIHITKRLHYEKQVFAGLTVKNQ